MTYDLNDVVRYTTEIVNKFLPGNKLKGTLKNQKWGDLVKSLVQRSDAYLQSKSVNNLAYYAEYLRIAANFLLTQKTVSLDQRGFIDRHVNHLHEKYCQISKNAEIRLPSEVEIVKTKEELQIEKFRENLKALIEYRDLFLINDQRSHSYFCGSINLKVNKVPTLNNLINELEHTDKIDDIKFVLNKFYLGKHSGNSESPYAILSTGQNVTTRLFSYLGFFSRFVRSDTIKGIDALACSVGVDPNEVPPVLSINNF